MQQVAALKKESIRVSEEKRKVVDHYFTLNERVESVEKQNPTYLCSRSALTKKRECAAHRSRAVGVFAAVLHCELVREISFASAPRTAPPVKSVRH